MQKLAALAGLALLGYGFVAGGWRGALTGLVFAFGVGSGLAIFFGERGTEVDPAHTARGASQQLGGLLAAGACAVGVVYGGWMRGWAWGAGGHVFGVGVAFLVAALTGGLRARPDT